MAKIRELTPELAVVARDELNEVRDRIPEDIKALRTWIEQQPHLKARTDDQFLVAFLRGGKYSLEKAKQKIDYFYTLRTLNPQTFLHKTLDDKALKLLRLGVFYPLPKPLRPNGPRVHITHFGAASPNEFTILDIIKLQLRTADVQFHKDDHAIVSGIVNVYNFKNMPMSYILQCDPTLIKKMTAFTVKTAPLRVKAVHFINVSKEAVTLINLCRSLLPKKIADRMTAHSTMESLYEHVPRDCLPEEYGGTLGTTKDILEDWEKQMVAFKPYFEEDLEYVTNEKLRVGPKIDLESVFGLEGSFRKLEVD